MLADSEFGPIALSALAADARWDEQSATELVELTSLITPDLRWCARREAELRLTRTHPTRRTWIQRTFRAARKAQRKLAA
ncbi:MAG: hypothetical protein ABWY11_25410 [Umezawaea sp.]